jgi:peptide/nickel transport system substrate-binding protein
MRRSKPLAFVAGVALLTLAACGGNGDNTPTGGGTSPTYQPGTSVPKDPTRQGPAADIEGATPGGTINVLLPSDPGPNDLDPSGGWSVTGNSIMQGLLERSLTQYTKDPKSGDMILVPDLATDLGTPNADFTEWKFTIKPDLKWEDGSPITAEQVAFGMSRSLDTTQFPGGPGTEYSVAYF